MPLLGLHLQKIGLHDTSTTIMHALPWLAHKTSSRNFGLIVMYSYHTKLSTTLRQNLNDKRMRLNVAVVHCIDFELKSTDPIVLILFQYSHMLSKALPPSNTRFLIMANVPCNPRISHTSSVIVDAEL